MKRKFYKYHGIGNDYIYFDCFKEDLPNPETLSKKLSDRHRSVGGDGIILIGKSAVADAKMRIFNADGSEGKMCGNGIRCVGKFLYEIKGIHRKTIYIETLSGVKALKLTVEAGIVEHVTVDMGNPILTPKNIPVTFQGTQIVDCPMTIGGTTYKVTCVSMGNPHCVIFVESIQGLDIDKIGPQFEHHPIFTESVNTEFVVVKERNVLEVRVWERGSRETLACGTGACAAAAASVLNRFCDLDADIEVNMKGGKLSIQCTNETVYMTGKAELAFTGEVEI